MIRIIVLLVILVYLFKVLTKFDRVKDKIYHLPKSLLGVAVAFVISFAVMTVMEKSGLQMLYDWAGVVAVGVFTLILYSILNYEKIH